MEWEATVGFVKKGLEILNQGDVKHMLGWPGRMIGEDAGGCVEKWVEDDLGTFRR